MSENLSSIDVEVPVRTAYDQWTQFEEFPLFMQGVQSVRQLDDTHLEWKAKELNFNTHIIALAGEINRKMPEYVQGKAMRVLNRAGIAPSRANVLVLGAGYKRDLGDHRESPAIEIMRLMQHVGSTVSYHDPYVPTLKEEGLDLLSTPLSTRVLEAQDLVIIATDHTTIDYGWVATHARQVLDTRNATRSLTHHRERLTLL